MSFRGLFGGNKKAKEASALGTWAEPSSAPIFTTPSVPFRSEHKNSSLHSLTVNLQKLKMHEYSVDGEDGAATLEKYMKAQRTVLLQAAIDGATIQEIMDALKGDIQNCLGYWIQHCNENPSLHGPAALKAMARLQKEQEESQKKVADSKSTPTTVFAVELKHIERDQLSYIRDLNRQLNDWIVLNFKHNHSENPVSIEDDEEAVRIKKEIKEVKEKLFSELDKLHTKDPAAFCESISEASVFDVSHTTGESKRSVMREASLSIGTLGEYLNLLERRKQLENKKGSVQQPEMALAPRSVSAPLIFNFFNEADFEPRVNNVVNEYRSIPGPRVK